MSTIIISLGKATANGIDAITQCLFFKTLMRTEIGRDPNGAWLHMASDRREMVVEYDPEVQGAYIWAKAAEERAELIWERVAGRQRTSENPSRTIR